MTTDERKGQTADDTDQRQECARCCVRQWPWAARCRPGSMCLHARSALGVHRFFHRNPSFGTRCATPEWPKGIRRAAAARAHPYYAPELLYDPDRQVRRQAIARAPLGHISPLREDADARVRVAVARRLFGSDLIIMIDDPDLTVRRIVAARVTTHMLPLMLGDADPHIRRVLARRIDASWLVILAEDPTADVRAIVAGRLQWAVPATRPD